MKVEAFSSLVSIKDVSFDTSRDSSGRLHPQCKRFPKEKCFYMTQSPLLVCDFDKFADDYILRKFHKSNKMSVDAVYEHIPQKSYVLIEFKNGNLEKKKDIDSALRIKLLSSLHILIDSENFPDYDFVRDNVSFILVYNHKNMHNVTSKAKQVAQAKDPEKSFEKFKQHFSGPGLANKVPVIFDLSDTYEGYLFKEVRTYSIQEFEKFFLTDFAKAPVS